MYEETISGKSNPWLEFTRNDIDWHIMRSKYTQEFYQLYNMGIQEYISGDWEQAKNYFEQANVSLYIKDFLFYFIKENS
jgi:hypothetical protein